MHQANRPKIVGKFHQEDARLEDCHFDFCGQCLATACLLSLLQDLRTRVQDFFPAAVWMLLR
jgi:hypothetical protein